MGALNLTIMFSINELFIWFLEKQDTFEVLNDIIVYHFARSTWQNKQDL